MTGKQTGGSSWIFSTILIAIAACVIIGGTILYKYRHKSFCFGRNNRGGQDLEHSAARQGDGESHILAPIRRGEEPDTRSEAETRNQQGSGIHGNSHNSTKTGPSEAVWFGGGKGVKNVPRRTDAGSLTGRAGESQRKGAEGLIPLKLSQPGQEGMWLGGAKRSRNLGRGSETDTRIAAGLTTLELGQPGQEGMWLSDGKKNKNTKKETDSEDGDMGLMKGRGQY